MRADGAARFRAETKGRGQAMHRPGRQRQIRSPFGPVARTGCRLPTFEGTGQLQPRPAGVSWRPQTWSARRKTPLRLPTEPRRSVRPRRTCAEKTSPVEGASQPPTRRDQGSAARPPKKNLQSVPVNPMQDAGLRSHSVLRPRVVDQASGKRCPKRARRIPSDRDGCTSTPVGSAVFALLPAIPQVAWLGEQLLP